MQDVTVYVRHITTRSFNCWQYCASCSVCKLFPVVMQSDRSVVLRKQW